ncbi:MAG: MFS transporter [Anaerovoracaceae bacterium]|jgi:OFA family oxalate/formate antiporter-like MFS transporter
MESVKKVNRWKYIAAGALMLLFLGLIYAWSIFKVPLNQVYPDWSVSQISLTFTISMICFCLFGFLGGKLQTWLTPRVIVFVGGLLIFCGFFGVSFMDAGNPSGSLIRLYLLYGILCGGGVGMCYNVIISTVNKWFPDRQGLASGIMLMGFGFGGIILGSIVNELIGVTSVFVTFRVLAVAILVVIGIGSFFLKRPDVVAGKSAATGGKEYSLGEMLKTGAFWCFFIWSIFINSAGLLVINSAAPIALAFGAPAVLGLIVSVFNGAGRVIIGAAFDRVGRKWTILLDVVIMLTAGGCLLLGAATAAVVFIMVGLLLTGVAYGGSPTISSALIHSTFGPKNFPVNFSIATFSLMPAAIIGPMISSRLIESSGGAYGSTFVMVLILGAGALVMWGLLNVMIGRIKDD